MTQGVPEDEYIMFVRFRCFARALVPRGVSLYLLVFCLVPSSPAQQLPEKTQPNVLLILTDDQGYGDLGSHGNPQIKTPRLDEFAKQSVELTRFFVCPVCSPTRSSLLTGRYNYRTGVVDTYRGRSMMRPDEVTLAEMLSAAGYRTGIFGKWHLGDNAPMRSIDQGFQVSLVHRGGGIGQPSDPPEGTSYFDPILQENGVERRFHGYCSDIFTSAAIDFVRSDDPRPFFTYLAFNAPHDPLEVSERDLAAYKGIDLSPAAFPNVGQPLPATLSQDRIARLYGMVSNIDANVGRLLKILDERKLAENTIVVFLTDNGPAFPRFNAGLRGLKGTVYEGGIRVPFFVRWPGHFPAGATVDRIAAHIDLVPTLLDACGVSPPKDVKLDGHSLLPLLEGKPIRNWPDRTLFFQWHRGDEPVMGRAFAVRTQQYKLVSPERPAGQSVLDSPELYDVARDPYEQTNIAEFHPEMTAILLNAYRSWFRNVRPPQGYEPSRIAIGSKAEPRTVLTRQDWRGPRSEWSNDGLGYWEVEVEQPGPYEIEMRLVPRKNPGQVQLILGETKVVQTVAALADSCRFSAVRLPVGPGRLEASVRDGSSEVGIQQLTIQRIGAGLSRSATP
jgi:arylsulfatase A-like enzyme